jgi:type IV pilus assembly protein PilQ
MGEVVKRTRRGKQALAAVICVSWMALVATGCSSAPAPKTTVAQPTAAAASQTPSEPTAEVTALDLREGAPGVLVDVSASGPLVWTSYRDADGALVVELPNTTVSPTLQGLNPDSGMVAAVAVRQDSSGDRPLTRIIVTGREEFEYNLVSENQALQLRLTPVVSTVAEPLASPAPEAVAAVEPVPAAAPARASAPAVVKPAAGTADRPLQGPAPAGRAATRLQAVSVDQDTVDIAGDGEFAYSTFRLENPDRFVIDLQGVTNAGGAPATAVGGDYVDRVRVAQFKPAPEAVSRVVFDLKRAGEPSIERSAGGLRVRFGDAPPTLAEDLHSEPSPEPAEVAASTPASPAAEPAAAEISAPATQAPVAAPEKVAVTAAPSPAPQPVAPPAPKAAPVATDVALFEAADVRQEAPEAAPSPSSVQVPTAYAPQPLGEKAQKYVGEPMSLHLKDADIKDVLRSFAQISGLNIVVQPGVRGTVTVELESVPWDQALEMILKVNDLGMQLEGNVLRIAPRDTLQREAEQEQRLRAAQALSVPLRTVMRRISYADAGSIAQVLSQRGGPGVGGSLMSDRGSITVDARTNTLIIKELPAYMDTVIAVIENLDTPEPQVMIEARIVETTKRFSRTLGIAWGFNGVADAEHGNTTGLVFPNSVEGNGGVNLLTGGSNGFLNIDMGNILDTFHLNATLQAAEAEGLINVLSAPKVATLNNNSAEIQSGLQIPIQTVANNTVTVQFVNATLHLLVTPHVTAEGTVLMDINVQKREPQLAFAVVGATNAPIATKEARTRVIVRDGGTTVIGGIYKVSTDQGEDRVPGLANIPVLGHLFRNHRRNDENEELLIFITPRVIKL